MTTWEARNAFTNKEIFNIPWAGEIIQNLNFKSVQFSKLLLKRPFSANETDSDPRLWLDMGNIFHVLRINFTRVSLVEENLDFLDDDEIDQSREILNNLYCKQTEIYARL